MQEIAYVAAITLVLLFSIWIFQNMRSERKYATDFLLFSFFAYSWQMFVGLALLMKYEVLLSANMSFLSALLMSVFLMRFVSRYLGMSNRSPVRASLFGLIGLSLVLTILGQTITGFTEVDGFIRLERGVGYFVVVAAIIISISQIAKHFFSKMSHTVSSGERWLILGISVGVVSSTLTNIVLPNVLESSAPSAYGPLGYAFLVSGVAYGVIKHGLFGVRRASVRSAGYTVSLLLLFGAYYGVAVLFVNNLLGEDIRPVVLLAVMLLAAVAALSYEPIKNTFAYFTDKVFFRDAYNLENVVSEMTKVVTSRIEMESIVEDALNVFRGSVKPETILFLVDSRNDPERDEIDEKSTSTKKMGPDSLRLSNRIMIGDHMTGSVKAMRLLGASESDFNLPTYGRTPKELQDFMLKKDIGFAQAMKTADRTVGYIVMGPKSSGSAYDMQDVKMLNITSGQLAVAIENSLRFESIKQFNIKLQKDIKDATRKLERTNKRLLELDKTKDDFISIASHQLRTPLTSIKGYMSMLSEGMFGKVSKEQNKALTESIASSNRMVFLIADLLSTSRLRSGKFSVDASVFDIAKEVRNQSKQLEPLAKAKNIKLTTHLPRGGALINADQMKISQVLMNFMDNAIHYTPEGGQVDVHLSKKGRSIEFKVIDNGIGIPEKDQREIFGKFFRASNAQRFRPDGTGIGVFIARKIITLHKGDTIFKSKEGEGSTFGFKIPIGKTASKSRR